MVPLASLDANPITLAPVLLHEWSGMLPNSRLVDMIKVWLSERGGRCPGSARIG